MLEKIVTLTSRQTSNDITKLSRWLRCLFSLSLTYDETIGLKCINHAVDLAQKRQGVSLHLSILPKTYILNLLEGLACPCFIKAKGPGNVT